MDKYELQTLYIKNTHSNDQAQYVMHNIVLTYPNEWPIIQYISGLHHISREPYF